MLQEFSSGYFLTTLTVTPHSGEYPVIYCDAFAEMSDKVETYPLVMKVANRHFCVYSYSAIPDNVLGIPEAEYDALKIGSPAKRRVLVAKLPTLERLVETGFVKVVGDA